MKRPLRVAILTHEELIPPDDVDSMDDKAFHEIRREWGVADALDEIGHEVRFLGVHDELTPIRHMVAEWKPHIIFNLLMEFQDVGFYQVHVTSYLELLRIPFTGCNSRGILLARDKAVSKKIMRYHRIPTPAFAVFRRGRSVRPPKHLPYPLIVKTVDEEASYGISQASICRNEEQLRDRVAFLHESMAVDALAEQYIEGRELTISVLGNQRLQTFPLWELSFHNLPEGAEPIATENVKWNQEYQKRIGVKAGLARRIPEEQRRNIARMAKRIYRMFELSGYARIDLRLAPDGHAYVIEVNATPDITYDEDLSLSARGAGVSYETLLQRILNLGLRYRSPWRSR